MATTGSKIEDLTGQKFGRLLVKARAPNKIYPSGQQATMWICICDCGQTKTIRSFIVSVALKILTSSMPICLQG